MPRILITGSLGQIGTELVGLLRQKYGQNNVLATDIKKGVTNGFEPYEVLDVLDFQSMEDLISSNNIDWIIHNASILSATGEKNPLLALKVNNGGFQNAIELAKKYNLRILTPSSIAAFGPSTPKTKTPDTTIMRPTTMYGLTKVHIELLGEYYHQKWNVDFRSLRYPGIISSGVAPGGGTTDYAVAIFYEALKTNHFECFLEPSMTLPMMYMPDCLKGTLMLLETDETNLQQRVFNLAAMSFNPAELEKSIQRHLPDFHISYKPDYREAIAESWPRSISDTAARTQWQWQPDYDLDSMVEDMLEKIAVKLNIPYQSAMEV